jgi:phosphatidylglycerophosphate synthase
MEAFRPRDLLSTPGFLTLVRVPLALAFPFSVNWRPGALAILAGAALSDILDGWCARRSGRTSLAGGIVDPIVDKLFVGSVALTLLATGRLSLLATLLLGSRDLVELPIALWLVFNSQARRDRSNQLKANVFGKIVTVLQFTTVVAALMASRYVTFLAVSSGLAGVTAGATYWTLARRKPPAHVNGHDDPGSSWHGTQTSPNGRPS